MKKVRPLLARKRAIVAAMEREVSVSVASQETKKKPSGKQPVKREEQS